MKKTGNVVVVGILFGLGMTLQCGCAGNPVTRPAAQTASEQLEGAKRSVKIAAPEKAPLEGTVLETMNAGGYTYISLEKDGKKGWVAVPATTVAVGQEIKVAPGMEMGLFSSKTLNRSFDNITFSPGLVSEAQSRPTQVQPTAETSTKLPAGHKAGDKKTKSKGMAAMFGSAGGGESEGLSGKVVETMDAGGYTYINLEKDGTQTWAAVPTMKVTVGEEMNLQPGAVMKNFVSKSMNKTFDSVVFSGGPVPGK